jgi:hypothetical protein
VVVVEGGVQTLHRHGLLGSLVTQALCASAGLGL